MSIDMKKLAAKFDEIVNDPNFEQVFDEWLKNRKTEAPTVSLSKNYIVEDVDRYYYASGRNHFTYEEITYWIDPLTLSRRETARSITIQDGEEYKLPLWAKTITFRLKKLEPNFF